MKNYTGLIPRYLKKQPRRSLMTILGIVLAVALITSVGIMGKSIQNAQIESIEKAQGSHHACIKGLTRKQADILKNHAKIGQTGVVSLAGSHDIPDNDISILVGSWDKNAVEMRNITLVSGKLPEKGNEIILEEVVLGKLGLEPRVGEKVKLDIKLTESKGTGNTSSSTTSMDFVLSGIYKKLEGYGAYGTSYGIITHDTVIKLAAPEGNMNMAFIRVKDGLPIIGTLDSIPHDIGADSKEVVVAHNSELIRAIGEEYPGENRVNGAKISRNILVFLIVISTAAGIFNIFHISVLERIQQFGMLRSLGTTPGQIRRMVLGEALMLSAVSIPGGLIFGILLSKGMSLLMAGIFGSISHITVTTEILLVSAAIGAAAVLISAYSPALVAAKVSPLEAIKSNNDVIKKSKIKQKKWHTLIAGVSGVSGKMAWQNLWRNRKRFLVTVFSMCIGIILFIVFSYYISLFDILMADDMKSDYILATNTLSSDSKSGYTRKVYDEIRDMKDIKSVLASSSLFGFTMYPEGKMTPAREKEYSQYSMHFPRDSKTGAYPLHSYFNGFSADLLEEAIKCADIGEPDIGKMSYEPEVLLVDKELISSGKSVWKPGDEIEVRFTQVVEGEGVDEPYKTVEVVRKVKIAGLLRDFSYGFIAANSPTVIMHEDLLRKWFGDINYQRFDIFVNSDADSKAIEKSLKGIADGVRYGRFYSREESKKENEENKKQVTLLCYGLVAILGVIGITNIINTISSNLIIRTREFGTLRSIGMTEAQMKKMVSAEGAFYGLVSSFWGSIIGVLLAYILFVLIKSDMHDIAWILPWKAVTVATAVNISVGILATFSPLKKISSMNIIESIKAVE